MVHESWVESIMSYVPKGSLREIMNQQQGIYCPPLRGEVSPRWTSGRITQGFSPEIKPEGLSYSKLSELSGEMR